MAEQSQGLRPPGRIRPATAILALVAVLGVSSAIVAYAADPQLDQADAALQKADALLEASQSGAVPPLVKVRFALHVNRARALIARARRHVAAAKAAVDGQLQPPVVP
jgi:hypothetical protein